MTDYTEMESFLREQDPEFYAEKDAAKQVKEQSKLLGTTNYDQPAETAMSFEDELESRIAARSGDDTAPQELDPYAVATAYDSTPASEVIDAEKYEATGMANHKIQGHKVILEGQKPLVKVGDEWLDSVHLDKPGYFTPEQEKIVKSVHDEWILDERAVMRGRQGVGDYTETREGLDEPWLRTKIAAAETWETKQELFKKDFPDGELAKDADGTIKFIKNPSEHWQAMDPSASMSPVGDIPADVGEFIGGDTGQIIGETIGAISASKGGGFVWNLLKIGMAGMLGDVVQEQYEDKYLGWDASDNEMNRVGQHLTKFGFSIVGGGVFQLGNKTFNAFTGSGFLELPKDARMAIMQAKEMGINPPTIASITKSKGWAKVEAQADSITNKISDYTEQAQLQIKARLETNINSKDGQYLIDGGLERDLDIYWQDSIANAKVSNKSMGESGDDFFEAMSQWDTDSQTYVGAAYSKARELEAPQLDIAGMQKRIADVESSKQVATIKMQKQAQNVFDTKGKMAPKKVTEPVTQHSQKVQEKMDLIARLDPERVDMDQLIYLRTELWNMKKPSADGTMSEDALQAGELYRQVSKTMNKPLNGGLAGERYSAAAALAAKRFQLKDQMTVLDLAKKIDKQAPSSKAIAQIIGEADESSMKQIQNLLKFHTTPETGNMWKSVQEAFVNDLADTPLDIVGKLDKMRPAARKMLVSPEDEKMLRAVGEQIMDLNRSGIQKAVQEQATVKGMVDKVLLQGKDGNTLALKGFLEKNPHAHQVMKSAMYENLVEKITQFGVKDGKLINEKSFASIVRDTVDSPVGKMFINAQDRQMLNKIGPIVKFYFNSGDIQASLLGGEIMAGITRLEAKSMIQLIKYNSLGSVLTNKPFIRWMTGTGKAHSKRIRAQTIAMIASTHQAQYANEAWQEGKLEERVRKQRAQAVGAY